MISLKKSSSRNQDHSRSPATSSSTQVTVRKMATGSLMAASISSRPRTLGLISNPCRWSRKNTAAASVELTIEPIRMLSTQPKPRTSFAAAPVSRAVSATPTVASSIAGQAAARKFLNSVRSPPSNRMMASAMVPMV